MENNKMQPGLNLDMHLLSMAHSFNCTSRDTSDHIVIKRHLHISDAYILFCVDCGNPLCLLDSNNSFISFI